MFTERGKLKVKTNQNLFQQNNISTPCFVIKTDAVDVLLNGIKTSLHKYWAKGIVGYSFKTNNLPCVISHMKSNGCLAEVVSSDEYTLAKRMGYSNDQIIFNGPVKGKAEFLEAVLSGSIINIDSKRELNWLLDVDESKRNSVCVGLRVNFCLEKYCPGESQCGEEDGRFGFSYEKGELKKAIDFIVDNGFILSGLHLHCSSKTRNLNIYEAIANITVKIAREYSLALKYADVGGGFFGGVPNKPSFDEYFNCIYKIFSQEPLMEHTNLIIEPGMSVIGSSVEYWTRVVDTKVTANNYFVTLDGSRIHIDPLMKKSSYSYRIVEKDTGNANDKVIEQILCGFTCMEGDRFFKLCYKPLHENDFVVFEKVGAYTIGLAPQFINAHPKIYINNGEKIWLVQDKKSLPTE